MIDQAGLSENLGEVVGYLGEAVSEDCLVLRLLLRGDLNNHFIEMSMTADMVVRLAAELARISTQTH